MESLSTNPSDALVFHFTQNNQDSINAVENSKEKNSDGISIISTSTIIQEIKPSSAEKVEIWVNGVKRVIFVPRVNKPDSNKSIITEAKTPFSQSSANDIAVTSVNSINGENSIVSRTASTNANDLPSSRCIATVAPQRNHDFERTLSSSSATVSAKSLLGGIREQSSVVKREKQRSPKDCFDYSSGHEFLAPSANTSDITHRRTLVSQDHHGQMPYKRLPSSTVPLLPAIPGLEASSAHNFTRSPGSRMTADSGVVRKSYAPPVLRSIPAGSFGNPQYPVQPTFPARQVHRPVAVPNYTSLLTQNDGGFNYPRSYFFQEHFARPLDTRWGERPDIPTELTHASSLFGAGPFLQQKGGVCNYSHLMSTVDPNKRPSVYGMASEQRPTLPVHFNQGRFLSNFGGFTIPQLPVVSSSLEQIRAGNGFGVTNRFLNPQNFTNGISQTASICSRLDLPAVSCVSTFDFRRGGILDSSLATTAVSGAALPFGLPGPREALCGIRPYDRENLCAAGVPRNQPVVNNIVGLPPRVSQLCGPYTNGMFPIVGNQETKNERPNDSYNPVSMLRKAYQHQFASSVQSFLNTNSVQHGSCFSSNVPLTVLPPNVNISMMQSSLNSQPALMSSPPNALLNNLKPTAVRASDLLITAPVNVSSLHTTVMPSCVSTSTLAQSQTSVSISSNSQPSGSPHRLQPANLLTTANTYNCYYDSGDVQNQKVTKAQSDTRPLSNCQLMVSTSALDKSVEPSVVPSTAIGVPPLSNGDGVIRNQSLSNEHNAESLTFQGNTKISSLCVSMGSSTENPASVQDSNKTRTVSTSRPDDGCKMASKDSAKSHLNDQGQEHRDQIGEQSEQQEQPESPQLQFISDVMTSMDKFSDDASVHQWLDSLMDNITESSRDSIDCQSKAKTSIDKTSSVNAKNAAEPHIAVNSKVTNSQKKQRTWIGIKSIEAEMASKSSNDKPKRRKRRRLTMRASQSPDPSCDGSSDSWHPDGYESSNSSVDTIVSSVPSTRDSSTSSWSSNDSVTIGRRSRKNRKRVNSDSPTIRTRRRRSRYALQSRETSPWQRIHPRQGEIYECFVSLELLCLKGKKSINARRANDVLCCKSVKKIIAKENWSSSEDSWLNRKRRKIVKRNESNASGSKIGNSSDSGDSYESWKPFKSKKRFLRLQI